MTVRDGAPAPRRRRRVAVAIAWGVVVWCALWGEVTVANVLWGAVLAGATVWLVPLAPPHDHLQVRPLAVLRFAGWFVVALVRASAVVAWEVVTPDDDINEAIVAVPLSTDVPGLVTLIANTISLTPGTLTLEVRAEAPTLWVHVLHLRDVEDMRAEVEHIERMVCATFGVVPETTAATTTRHREEHSP